MEAELAGPSAGLWLAVVASGLYHGVNPGMGWPLAVSAGMMEKSPRALAAALGALAAGHCSQCLLMILPFSLLISLIYWRAANPDRRQPLWSWASARSG